MGPSLSATGRDIAFSSFVDDLAIGAGAADITGNGLVNVDDLLAVINAWGPCAVPPSPCPADIAPAGGDDNVNVEDLLMIINHWS
jgi:hypothetical protein